MSDFVSRFAYVKYDDQAQAAQDSFKPRVEELERMAEMLRPRNGGEQLQTAHARGGDLLQHVEVFARANGNVDKAIAALEEFYMWIGKTIKDGQIIRNGTASLLEGRKDG